MASGPPGTPLLIRNMNGLSWMLPEVFKVRGSGALVFMFIYSNLTNNTVN